MRPSPTITLKSMSAGKPYLINFSSHGSGEEGFLYVAAQPIVPFSIHRSFWTVGTPIGVMRGGHAHFETEMVLIAIQGTIRLECETREGLQSSYVLDRPDQGIYLPRLCWHTMHYSRDAIQLALASTDYREADYIRDYEVYTQLARH